MSQLLRNSYHIFEGKVFKTDLCSLLKRKFVQMLSDTGQAHLDAIDHSNDDFLNISTISESCQACATCFT